MGRVGAVIARGEAVIGFRRLCELLEVPGIDYVGPLPANATSDGVLCRCGCWCKESECGSGAGRVFCVGERGGNDGEEWPGSDTSPLKLPDRRWSRRRAPGGIVSNTARLIASRAADVTDAGVRNLPPVVPCFRMGEAVNRQSIAHELLK